MRYILGTKKWGTGISVFFILMLATVIVHSADIVPFTFLKGEVVSASRMNANFEALEAAISSGVDITIIRRENGSPGDPDATWTSELVTALCGVDEVLIGASCECTHEAFNSSTTNYGFLRYCGAAGNGVVGGCVSTLDESDINKDGPPARVFIFCAKITDASASLTGRALQSQSGDQILSDETEYRVMKIEEEFQQYEEMLQRKASEK